MQEAVRVFQNLDEEVLLKPAADGGWSIAQCLAHLNSYGDYYLPRLRAGFESQQEAAVAETYKGTWLGNQFIRMMAPETGRKKYKAAKIHLPKEATQGQAIVREFIRQQEELLLLLRQAHKADLDANKIPVSVLTWLRLKPGDVLQFVVAHNERHMLQAERNLPVPDVAV